MKKSALLTIFGSIALGVASKHKGSVAKEYTNSTYKQLNRGFLSLKKEYGIREKSVFAYLSDLDELSKQDHLTVEQTERLLKQKGNWEAWNLHLVERDQQLEILKNMSKNPVHLGLKQIRQKPIPQMDVNIKKFYETFFLSACCSKISQYISVSKKNNLNYIPLSPISYKAEVSWILNALSTNDYDEPKLRRLNGFKSIIEKCCVSYSLLEQMNIKDLLPSINGIAIEYYLKFISLVYGDKNLRVFGGSDWETESYFTKNPPQILPAIFRGPNDQPSISGNPIDYIYRSFETLSPRNMYNISQSAQSEVKRKIQQLFDKVGSLVSNKKYKAIFSSIYLDVSSYHDLGYFSLPQEKITYWRGRLLEGLRNRAINNQFRIRFHQGYLDYHIYRPHISSTNSRKRDFKSKSIIDYTYLIFNDMDELFLTFTFKEYKRTLEEYKQVIHELDLNKEIPMLEQILTFKVEEDVETMMNWINHVDNIPEKPLDLSEGKDYIVIRKFKNTEISLDSEKYPNANVVLIKYLTHHGLKEAGSKANICVGDGGYSVKEEEHYGIVIEKNGEIFFVLHFHYDNTKRPSEIKGVNNLELNEINTAFDVEEAYDISHDFIISSRHIF